MKYDKSRYINTSVKVERNRLKAIYSYMVKKGLNHDTLMKEIVEKRCGLPTSHREYIILRDFLGNKIKTEIPKTNESK